VDAHAGSCPDHRPESRTACTLPNASSARPPSCSQDKSYEATVTGLNQNSYLWKTLPSYGELLTQYYGTGHHSLDNYISLVGGQSPPPDDQADCATYEDVAPGFAAPDGQTYASSGCVYPRRVKTLFNPPLTGTVRVTTADLSSRDETGHAVRLRPRGVAAVTASPHHPGTLRVVGRYGSGAAQVTYRHRHDLVAIWDLDIELD
jgi:hypothetical protein